MAVDMTRGTIGKQLLLYALPILLGELLQQLYSTVDTIIVGNWIGDTAMAAVGGTSTVTRVLVGFFNGISVGCTVVVARYFGAKDGKKLRQSVYTIMLLALVIGVVLSMVGILIVSPVLWLLEIPQEVMPLATVYVRICFGGLLGLILYNTVTGILRAVGNVRLPFVALIVSALLNIVLDLLFVVVFRWGVAGVAYATIMAQAISALWCLGILLRTDADYSFRIQNGPFEYSIAKEVLIIGIPTGVQKMLTALSNVVVLSYINFFGSSCLAGWVVYTKVNHFIVVALQSLGSSITTFVSQNIGAKQYKRAQQGVTFGLGIAMLLTIILSILIKILQGNIVRIFGTDLDMQYYASMFLSNLILFQVFHVLQSIYAGALRGFGEAVKTTATMLFCLIIVRQIYLWSVTRFINTPIIVGFAFPLGWLTSGCLLLLFYRRKIHPPGQKD